MSCRQELCEYWTGHGCACEVLSMREPVMDPKSSRARILELEAKLHELEVQREMFKPAVEYATGRDEWDVDEWTIATDGPAHLSHIGCCGRQVFKREAWYGPWVAVDEVEEDGE